MGRKEAKRLTPRQREWQGHLRAAARGGETVRAYAKRHRLSEHAMYSAAKELRQRGLLPEVQRRRAPKARPGFVKVSLASNTGSAGTARTWRARLPNGVVLEGTDALERELLEALAGL